MKIHENSLRDIIYNKYKNNFFEQIIGVKNLDNIEIDDLYDFPKLLKKQTEDKINRLVENLLDLEFIGREIRLIKEDASTTRIDLVAMTLDSGPAIIELKKSKQTEREAFTELLAYSNYVCSLFPGASESTSVISILIAPMETRIVQDAYFQELMLNNKNIIALIPEANESETEFKFKVYYPHNNFYVTFSNSMFHDDSIRVSAFAFQLVEGWIDTYEGENGENSYVKDAFNSISSNIALELESHGYHAFVYGSQRWKEHHSIFPLPNVIYVVTLNPFINDIYGQHSWSEERESRLYSFIEQLDNKQVNIFDDIESTNTEFFEKSHIGFDSRLWDILNKAIDNSFLSRHKHVSKEGGSLSWSQYKRDMVESVFFHHFDIYQTGIFRKTILEYIQQMYKQGEDSEFYSDDLPMFAYDSYRKFFFNWLIIEGLGYKGEEDLNVSMTEVCDYCNCPADKLYIFSPTTIGEGVEDLVCQECINAFIEK
ncbi:hypothetical protein [Acinetobacter sp. ANC 5045]|uniref:hypothetical protein n=1 Tax=Acinetobacter sp. ANC 5045 TaxID=2529851 RepID=UPI00103A1B75|nr:hypothetical protein [Acinetobacter sp. ANC 5045]TCB20439.1 hypothetical protein E0H79_03870 [Acinetobacter sp. ANC 5045]